MGDNDELIRRINEVKMVPLHSVRERDLQTPGEDNSMDKLGQVCLPADFTGKSVLDIGAWDGFFSFQAEKNGGAHCWPPSRRCWSLVRMGDQGRLQPRSRSRTPRLPAREIRHGTANPHGGLLLVHRQVLYHFQDPMGGSTMAPTCSLDWATSPSTQKASSVAPKKRPPACTGCEPWPLLASNYVGRQRRRDQVGFRQREGPRVNPPSTAFCEPPASCSLARPSSSLASALRQGVAMRARGMGANVIITEVDPHVLPRRPSWKATA